MNKESEKAIVEWINTFENVSTLPTEIQDLNDGVALFEVVSDIDADWFRLIRPLDIGDSWVLRLNNLKKLYRLITRYYEEKLETRFSYLPEVNLNAIAKDSNPEEILQLSKYILTIAVCCPGNSKYIQKITELDGESQQYLMQFIDETMRYNKSIQPEPQLSSDYTDGFQLHAGIDKIAKEKQQIELKHSQLEEKYARLLEKYEKLETENQDLNTKIKDITKEQSFEFDRSTKIMSTEIDALKQELSFITKTKRDQEKKLNNQSNQIKELTLKNQELLVQIEKIAELQDEVDENRRVVEKLQKAEILIDKYKKKLEETNDLRQQVKVLEDQNHELIESHQKIEDDYHNVLAFKTLMESYKDQVASLETKNNELIREKNKLLYDSSQDKKRIESLESDKAKDEEQIHSLIEQLEEVQSEIANVTLKKKNSSESDLMEVDEEIQSKRRIEEKRSSMGEHRVVVLQRLLDDTNRVKDKLEKEYDQVCQERDQLQSEMARIREGIPDAILEESSQTLSLRLHVIELENKIIHLNEAAKTLEKKTAEWAQANEGFIQHQVLEKRVKELEEQSKRQLQEINKLLLDKNRLQEKTIEQKDLLLEKSRLNHEIKEALAVYEAQDEEPIRQKNANLQRQCIELQENLFQLEIKHKKLREFVRQQDELIKSTRNDQEGHFEEAVESLKTEVEFRDEQITILKKKLKETQLQSRREQQLMVSAWYDVTSRLNRDLQNGQPVSWLGQQRHGLDRQIKRQ